MTQLPSQQSAALLVKGEPLALGNVLAHVAGRGAIVFVGALIAGAKPDTAVRAAVGGSLLIEAFVLLHELHGAMT